MQIKKVTSYIVLSFLLMQHLVSLSFATSSQISSAISLKQQENSISSSITPLISDEASFGLISDEANIEEEIKKDFTKDFNESPEFSNNRVIIKYKDGKSIQGKAQTERVMKQSAFAGAEIENFNNVEIGVLTFDDPSLQADDIKDTIRDLNKLPYVEYAEPDYMLSIEELSGVVSNDPRSDELWYLKSIHADTAWEIYNDMQDKTLVSVNDTGVDYTHQDLIENLKDLSTDCKSSTGATIAGGCAMHGRNFESGYYPIFEEDDTYDINGHGTHVSGVIGATKNNNTGIVGVTQNTEIIATRMDTYDSLYQAFYMSDTIKALDFAIQNNVKVVNASYGTVSFSQAGYDSIQRAQTEGILVIAAAGNENNDNDVTHHYPSDYDLDNIISVGAVGPDDTLSSYSNYGKTTVDIMAPGGDITDFETGEGGILSTYPGQEVVWSENFDSADNLSVTGTGSDWGLLGSGQGVYTQSSEYYTGSVNSTLIMNTPFSLSGATIGMLQGYMSCDFGSDGLYDQDFGDELNFYIYDQDSGINNQVVVNFSSYGGAATNYRFNVPIEQSYLFKDNLLLNINFVTDDDDDVGRGCLFDELEIIAHTKDVSSYKYLHGTSMAAPVVSGVAAMLWSYKPELTYQEIKEIIFTSTDQIGLTDKSVTEGKINAEKSLKELIRRYGISKSGAFGNEEVLSKNISLLNDKYLSLSGTTIRLTGTGNIIQLEENSQIDGSGSIVLPLNTDISTGSGIVFSNNQPIDVSFTDVYDAAITQSGQTVYGDGITLSYSGSISGSGTYIKVGDIYDGPLVQGDFIPVSESFSGVLDIQVYNKGTLSPEISDDIRLILQESVTPEINFIYSTQHFELTPLEENKEIEQDFGFSLRAQDYNGDVLNYTGSVLLSSSRNTAIFTGSLSTHSYTFQAGDNGEKIFTGALYFSASGSYDMTIAETGSGTLSGNKTINILPASIPEGDIEFSVDSITNSSGATLILTSSEYPVSYILSGDIEQSYSGTLISEHIQNVIFTPGDGIKNITLDLQDEDSHTGSITPFITVDTVSPVLTIQSHTPNQSVQGESIILSGSIVDTHEISSLVLQDTAITASGQTWEGEVSLTGGLNTVSYIVSDIAGNSSSGSIDIIRIPQIIDSPTTTVGQTNTTINFHTDLASQGLLHYGTGTGNLEDSIDFQLGMEQTLVLTSLSPSTQYSYTIQANSDTHEGITSGIYSFTTTAYTPSRGGGGGGGASKIPSCKEIDLVCKLVPGSEKTYKYYKDEGVQCRRGNLGKSCELSIAEKEDSTDGVINRPTLSSIELLRIYRKNQPGFEEFKNTSGDEEVTQLYDNFIASWKKLKTNYQTKSDKEKNKDSNDFINAYNKLKKKQAVVLRTQEISEVEFNSAGEYEIKKYTNKKIRKIQILLLARIRKNNGSSEDYIALTRFLDDISLLQEPSLTDEKKKKLLESVKKQYTSLRFKL